MQKKFKCIFTLLITLQLCITSAYPDELQENLPTEFANHSFQEEAPETCSGQRYFFKYIVWNICGLASGHTISDGGVMPWKDRISKIVQIVKEENPDILCLEEIFDASLGFYLAEELKEHYAHFYFNIGPKAAGVCSGLFFASKYKVENIEFRPFLKTELTGRSQGARKGCFAVDIIANGERVNCIFSHFGHSERPHRDANQGEKEEQEFKEEIIARGYQLKAAIELILDRQYRLHGDQEIPVMFGGDLNDDVRGLSEGLTHVLKDDESDHANAVRHCWHLLQQGNSRVEDGINFTWRGDTWCALATGKTPSEGVDLDHVFALNAEAKTTLIETNYAPKVFKPDALSDHEGLIGHFYFGK